jgi:hypothetical protein
MISLQRPSEVKFDWSMTLHLHRKWLSVVTLVLLIHFIRRDILYILYSTVGAVGR